MEFSEHLKAFFRIFLGSLSFFTIFFGLFLPVSGVARTLAMAGLFSFLHALACTILLVRMQHPENSSRLPLRRRKLIRRWIHGKYENFIHF